jgi:hypothetical protein
MTDRHIRADDRILRERVETFVKWIEAVVEQVETVVRKVLIAVQTRRTIITESEPQASLTKPRVPVVLAPTCEVRQGRTVGDAPPTNVWDGEAVALRVE